MANPLPDFLTQFSTSQPLRYVYSQRAPTTHDNQFPLSTGWFDAEDLTFYMLMSFTNQLANWVSLTPMPIPPETPNLGIKYFVEVTAGGAVNVIPNTCYFINAASLVTLNLPTSIAKGNEIEVIGLVGGWALAQSGAQQIIFQAQQTSPGPSGGLASTVGSDTVRLRCVVDDELFAVNAANGNLTVL